MDISRSSHVNGDQEFLSEYFFIIKCRTLKFFIMMINDEPLKSMFPDLSMSLMNSVKSSVKCVKILPTVFK